MSKAYKNLGEIHDRAAQLRPLHRSPSAFPSDDDVLFMYSYLLGLMDFFAHDGTILSGLVAEWRGWQSVLQARGLPEI